MKMEQHKDVWFFTDVYGSVWKLIPTQEPDRPLTIVLEKRSATTEG